VDETVGLESNRCLKQTAAPLPFEAAVKPTSVFADNWGCGRGQVDGCTNEMNRICEVMDILFVREGECKEPSMEGGNWKRPQLTATLHYPERKR
jgi:hypothetical protein